jgi:hypothetical protein
MFARLTACLLLLSLTCLQVRAMGAQPPVEEQPIVDDYLSGSETSSPAEAYPPGESCESCYSGGLGCSESESDVWLSDDVFHRGAFFARGWLDQGFTWNPDSPRNRFNTPVTFNDRSNEYQMNQLYLALGRKVRDDGCGWDVGGRVDLLYGTDYFFTTALGLETFDDGAQRWNPARGPRDGGHASLYGLAMPQLYAEVAAPFGCGTTFKFGHFNTIMGFESLMAPENFFYSHAYTMQYGEPFTHTGMLASYRYSRSTTIQAGLTRGWDTWENPNGKLSFLGGISWVSCDERSRMNFTVSTGDQNPATNHNRTSYSLVLSRQLTSRLKYVFQHDYGIESDAAINGDFQPTDAHWYGINQYLFYDMTPTTALGLRVEWFGDPENARVLGVPIEPLVHGGNYTEVSLGLNWRPRERVVVRPELRWDSSNVFMPGQSTGMYDDFSDKHQFLLGTDVIVVF